VINLYTTKRAKMNMTADAKYNLFIIDFSVEGIDLI